MTANDNARKIKEEIQYLSGLRDSENLCSDPKKRNYSSFWTQVKEINVLFKNLKPLSHEDREVLWKECSSLCASVKEEIELSNKERQEKSYNRYAQIHEFLYTYAMVDSLLRYPNIDEVIECGKNLKKAGLMLHEYKFEMIPEHKQMLFDEMQDIGRSHELWWEKFKSERDLKRRDFESRVRANLEKNYSRHSSATDALKRVQANADELRSKIASGGSDTWIDRWTDWLSESEDKIRDIERSIRQIDEWIEEDEKKLNR
jgi:hypothetical protein